MQKLQQHFTVIPLPPDETLAPPVRCHPDMLCAAVDNTLYFHESYLMRYPHLSEQIHRESGLTIRSVRGKRSPLYPEDIALNALVLPEALVCLPRHTAPDLLDAAVESGREILTVKQGYAGCSSLAVGSSVLTSDRGIHDALTAAGFDCTLMDNCGIRLPGYDVGFIGGCGGIYNRHLYLCGDPDSIPAGGTIRSFAEKHGLAISPLTDGALTDFGGLKFL